MTYVYIYLNTYSIFTFSSSLHKVSSLCLQSVTSHLSLSHPVVTAWACLGARGVQIIVATPRFGGHQGFRVDSRSHEPQQDQRLVTVYTIYTHIHHYSVYPPSSFVVLSSKSALSVGKVALWWAWLLMLIEHWFKMVQDNIGLYRNTGMCPDETGSNIHVQHLRPNIHS